MIRNFFVLKYDCHRFAGLLAALVVFLGSGKAEAELIISQTTIMPTSDPQSMLDFHLMLDPHTFPSPGDNLEIFSVYGFDTTTTPTYAYMNGGIDYSSYFHVLVSPANPDGTTNITLQYIEEPPPSLSNPTGNPLSIGDLYVTTTVPYPPPAGSPLFNTLNYTSTVGSDVFNGTTTPSLVPEPTSLALALVGAGFALPWLSRGRRRAAARS
jgi:hypothetical protein